jgi:hypothetical protein
MRGSGRRWPRQGSGSGRELLRALGRILAGSPDLQRCGYNNAAVLMQQQQEEEEDAGSSSRMLNFRLFLFRIFLKKVTLREAEVQSTCYMPYYCSIMKVI